MTALGRLVGALLGLHLVHLGIVAWRLQVDYWDGYTYLEYARALAGSDIGRLYFAYQVNRPPLVPLLNAPVMAGYAPAGGGTSLWGPHLVALALAVLSLGALYRLLREVFPPPQSLLGCALLGFNAPFIHYAPFVMTDVPAMLFATAGAVAYLAARREGRWLRHTLAAVFLAAAMLAKYSTVLLLGCLGLFEVLRVVAPRRGGPAPGLGRRAVGLLKDVRPWLVVAGSCLLLYLVHVGVFARLLPGVSAFRQLLDNLLSYPWMMRVPYASDPTYEYAFDLAMAFSPPLAIIALAGMVVAAMRRIDADLLCLAWFWGFFAMLTFFLGHKEVRFAFPFFPPFVYFVVAGLEWLFRLLVGASRRRRWPAATVPGLALLLAMQPARLAARELARFSDPVYTEPFLPRVARWVLDHAPPGQPVLITEDFIYTMYPADPVFLRYDETYYIHHIFLFAFTYLLDRPLTSSPAVTVPRGGDLAPLVERFARSEVALSSGSTYIDTTTFLSPDFTGEPPASLVLTFVGRRTLKRVGAATADRAAYEAAEEPPNRVVIARGGGGWGMVEGMPDAGWHVYRRSEEAGPASPLGGEPVADAPAVLELVKVEQVERAFR